MFGREKEMSLLEREIDRATRDLSRHAIGSHEYDATLERIVTLRRLKEEDKSKAVSKDNLAVVLGNLLGIFMIIKHENVNVVSSRALSLILRPFTRA
jgi:hypothetical protein